jgi:hypothetical protein
MPRPVPVARRTARPPLGNGLLHEQDQHKGSQRHDGEDPECIQVDHHPGRLINDLAE